MIANLTKTIKNKGRQGRIKNIQNRENIKGREKYLKNITLKITKNTKNLDPERKDIIKTKGSIRQTVGKGRETMIIQIIKGVSKNMRKTKR